MEVLRQKPSWARAWDALVDANPVLARELLVTARTPVYLRSIAVAPVLLGALLLLVRLAMGHHLDALVGRRLFSVYFTGLAIVLGTVGGALGSTVIVQEREARALDALKFSTLSPSRIVLGKFAAVVLAEAAVAACTLPLVVFVLAIGGVSLAEASVAIAIAVACGLMTASVGIAVSAHATDTRRSLLVSLLGSGAVGVGVLFWLGWAAVLGYWHDQFPFGVVRGYLEANCDGRALALLFVIPMWAVTTVLWFGYATATSGLMDVSEDRSLPIKRWTVGAFVLGTLALTICTSQAGASLRGFAASASLVATASTAAALLFAFAGEPVRPTSRMQAHPPSTLVRILYPRCLAPSILFAVVTSGIVELCVPVFGGATAELELDALWAVMFLFTLGGLIGCVAARRGPARARQVGAMALVGVMLLVPSLREFSPGLAWTDALCPLWLIGEGGAGVAQHVLAGSLAGWAAAAVVSMATMLVIVARTGGASSSVKTN